MSTTGDKDRLNFGRPQWPAKCFSTLTLYSALDRPKAQGKSEQKILYLEPQHLVQGSPHYLEALCLKHKGLRDSLGLLFGEDWTGMAGTDRQEGKTDKKRQQQKPRRRYSHSWADR